MPISKLERDGEIAVLISRGNIGWYSYYGLTEMLFDPVIAKAIENYGDMNNYRTYCTNKYGLDEQHCYFPIHSLVVKWIPKGTSFYVADHLGYESIKSVPNVMFWHTA